MDDETPKTCFKCGKEPVGPGGILGTECRDRLEGLIAR